MSRSLHRGGLVLVFTLLCLALSAVAAAASPPYVLEPELSLTGDCQPIGAPIDPVPDPGCPGGSHPPSGRFGEPRSVAIDAYGNEYVASYAGTGEKGRIDVFDDEGNFITEISDPHGPKSIAVDSKGNLYAFEQKSGTDGEVARYSPSLYKPATDEIEYKNPRSVVVSIKFLFNGGLAVDSSNDHLFIDEADSISVYSSAEEGNKLLTTISHPKLNSSQWVAVDAQRRRLFASYCKENIFKCGVLVFEADPPYNLIEELDGSDTPAGKFVSQKGWLSIAVDEENGHFFVDDLEASQRVYEFNESFEYVATVENEGFQGGNALQIAVSNSLLNKTARNLRYLFVPVLFAAGRVLAFQSLGDPPGFGPLEAANIGESEAELRATIDPNGGDTEYVIELEGPGIEGTEIVAQGTVPAASLPKSVTGQISGLIPGATYSARLVVENEFGDDEEEIVFATYSDALIVEPGLCSNQFLRSGPSATLPDCRAYELVTPADTNGRPTKGAGFEGDRFGMVQSSPLGSAVSFELIGGLPPGSEGTGGFHGDPYRATRSASGWSTALTGPTGTESSQPRPGSFSPDQGYSFWMADAEGSAVIDDRETHYVRYPDGRKELVGRGSLGTAPLANGKLISEGGTHIVFQTINFLAPAVQLEENAPPTGVPAVYDRTADEVTHVVSLLSGDVTPTTQSFYRGASPDGSGIAFVNEGTLYLRLNNTITFQIGNKGAVFAGVSEEGKRAFYVEGGDLKAFDTQTEEVIDFTETGDAVPVNVAPEGNRAYFVSEAAISGSGQNPNGAEAQLGEQNLYLSEEGTITFVGTVTERDVKGINTASGHIDGLGLWTEAVEKRPATDPSRLTSDGSVFLFQSRANLDGYDSGEFPQVYRYDSGAEELECLSCPPTKLPATGGASLQSFSITDLAAPFSQYGFVPNIRADGKRIFFESTEALVSSDTDEVRDVYEWEEEGVGSCTREGGCIYLISSGHSARNNYLFGHSASGDDVFFTTGDVLVGGDEDSVSVYDARVGGGFAGERGETCFEVGRCPQPTPPPSLTVPKSDVGTSSNVVPIRCPRGKRKAVRGNQIVCVKKKRHKKHHHRSSKSRPR